MLAAGLRLTCGIHKRVAVVCVCLHLSISHQHGDHSSGKPGNVREFDSCWGNVRDFTKVREMSGKNLVRGKVA